MLIIIIILMILGYLVIAGITNCIISATDMDDPASFVGLFWPIAVPVLIAIFIVMRIASGVEFIKDRIF